jgi:hypothetical protein
MRKPRQVYAPPYYEMSKILEPPKILWKTLYVLAILNNQSSYYSELLD